MRAAQPHATLMVNVADHHNVLCARHGDVSEVVKEFKVLGGLILTAIA